MSAYKTEPAFRTWCGDPAGNIETKRDGAGGKALKKKNTESRRWGPLSVESLPPEYEQKKGQNPVNTRGGLGGGV